MAFIKFTRVKKSVEKTAMICITQQGREPGWGQKYRTFSKEVKEERQGKRLKIVGEMKLVLNASPLIQALP